MIPAVANRGTSFKGAGLYYLHDKKRDGEKSRSTSDRVTWTDKRNLMSDDPDFNLRVMASTAMSKDQLKEQAGIRKGGRQSKGDVYSYSLAWHPDEHGKIDRAEMLSAVDQSIKSLGAQDHQAIIVCHNDEPHPHVHVVLNIVNPHNGKNLPLSNDFRKLEKWAHEYRKGRGEEKTYCQDRTKKMEAIEKRKQGKDVPFVRGKGEARQLHDANEAVRGKVPANDIRNVRTVQKEKDAALLADGRKMAEGHSDQWGSLSDQYQSKKSEISQRYWKEKEAAIADVKEEMKPAYRELFKQQWRERKAFEQRETRLTGKLRNIHDAINYAREIRGEENQYLLGTIFNFFADAGKRASWLNTKHANQLSEVRKDESLLKKDALSQLNTTRLRRYASARRDFNNDRAALIDRQKSEKAELSDRWKVRGQQRKRAFQALEAKIKIAPADERLLASGDKITSKGKFQDRAERRSKSDRTEGRSRQRKRKRSDE